MKRARESRALRPPAFGYQNAVSGARAAELYCEGVRLEHLAARHGTPLYVYSAAMIRARLNAFALAFQSIPHTLCYSVKANSTLAILRLIAVEGAGFDVVSGGELQRVLRINRKAAGKVVFSGVGKTAAGDGTSPALGNTAVQRGERIGIEPALSNRDAIEETSGSSGTSQPRRFGENSSLHFDWACISTSSACRFPKRAPSTSRPRKQPYLKVAGVSVHIGSQITDVASFQEAVERVADLIRTLRNQGHDIRYIDAGGGLGISYEGTQKSFEKQIAAYARAILRPLRGLKVHLLLEPGRSIVGPAGVLLTRVLYRKTNNRKRFLIVDAAMNDLLRPSLYGAYHEIVPVSRASRKHRDHRRRWPHLRNRRLLRARQKASRSK